MRKIKLSLHYEAPQEKPLPLFKHVELRQLTDDQRGEFQKRLESLVLEFDKRTRINMVAPKHEDTRRALIALEKHLNAICEIVCIGSVDDSETALAKAVYDWDSKDLERYITTFPITVAIMQNLVKKSLEYQTYKAGKIPAKVNHLGVALKAAFLLCDYKIKRTITTTGCWAAVTRYILCHGCGRNETDANLKNLMRECKFISTHKNEKE